MTQANTAVFVHGAGGGGWEWNVWRRVLAAHGWNARAPDLQPGAGGIPRTRIDEYVAQVLAWCSDAPPRLLIGASLGGLLALLVAARVRPGALVLVNPLPPIGIVPRPPLRAYPPVVRWASARSLESTQRALPDADAAACLYAFRRWRDESGAVLDAAAQGVACAPPPCPALVFASADDDDVPAATSAALARWCGGELRLLPGASHAGALLGRDAHAAAAAALDWFGALREQSVQRSVV